MFNFIKEKLQKIYHGISSQLQTIFTTQNIDQTTIDQVQQLLLKADTGVATTKKIIMHLEQAHREKIIQQGQDLQTFLHAELCKLLAIKQEPNFAHAQVFLMIGINGSGKTTFTAKLAHHFAQKNKQCLIAAADTFRAAAQEQIAIWSTQANATLISGKPNQDSASVVFDACDQFKKQQADILIIDTAGRLQTKENLMHELEKIKRIIIKQLPSYTICTLLTIDSMLGQNSLEQARVFHEVCNIDGIVLSKIDGSAKGGIVFSIVDQLQIPIAFLSWGEKIEDITPFKAEPYVDSLLGISDLKNKQAQ